MQTFQTQYATRAYNQDAALTQVRQLLRSLPRPKSYGANTLLHIAIDEAVAAIAAAFEIDEDAAIAESIAQQFKAHGINAEVYTAPLNRTRVRLHIRANLDQFSAAAAKTHPQLVSTIPITSGVSSVYFFGMENVETILFHDPIEGEAAQ